MACALNGLFDCVGQLLRRHIDKRILFDNLDALFILVDEICDGGYYILFLYILFFKVFIVMIIRVIMETEPANLLARVAARHEETVPISEQSVAQVCFIFNIYHALGWDNACSFLQF